MKFFIFHASHPTRAIAETECTMRVCKQTVWALLPDGRRCLIGSTAFQTIAAATRAKRGALERVVQFKLLRRRQPMLYAEASRQLHNMTMH